MDAAALTILLGEALLAQNCGSDELEVNTSV
jgi:hypothetical protein